VRAAGLIDLEAVLVDCGRCVQIDNVGEPCHVLVLLELLDAPHLLLIKLLVIVVVDAAAFGLCLQGLQRAIRRCVLLTVILCE